FKKKAIKFPFEGFAVRTNLLYFFAWYGGGKGGSFYAVATTLSYSEVIHIYLPAQEKATVS
ncbi:MAG: hypothetical protein ABW019_12820, partial [Chitinophagaceae bacterium]